jgi:hypothetical protein
LYRYSGVQRSAPAQANSNRYTPPARRAPTGQPTVPGAPHDPAIIASQLARPETLQQRQHAQSSTQATAQTQQPTAKTTEEAIPKPKERPGLPEIIAPRGGLAVSSPKPTEATSAIEREISLNFKNFVTNEKERVKKKKADMAHRDRESKLRELKKFSESFTLKTAVPQDLIPILAKDKTKQAEIIEKAKHGATKAAPSSSSQSIPSVAVLQEGTPGSQTGSVGGKVPPPYSFAARDPERFKRETSALLQGFPKLVQPIQSPLNQNIRRVQLDKTVPVRSPVPVAEPPRPQVPPTGPAASTVTTTAPGPPRRLNVNARPFEFKPNPSAAAFTPTSTGPAANAMPSPTVSSQANATSRATSPSIFFGNKRLRTDQERPSIHQNFNPFKRMKKAKAKAEAIETAPRKLYGNSNDYIDISWFTQPIWSTDEANKDKSYKVIFAKVEFDPNSVHSPQPPHMMPPQPHHQPLGAHMSHVGHPPHVQHQTHHGPIPQHLGIPPHYEQDPHLRQMSSPSSVMPSPSLHNATIAPYQQSPVPHPSQLAMYPGGQGAMGQYGGPGAPAGHQFGFYNGGFRGAPGGGPMMMHGPQPVPYPAGGQFVHQMYSPQQPQAYLNNGPPPPTTQGYPSPGRPAPMMMHQGSSQGTPGGAPMMPYGIQPGQNGPMYGAQGQQQSEFLPAGPHWLPQRPQSIVPLSSALSSPRTRLSHMSVQPSASAGGTPLLSPALAAFASPTLTPAPVHSSQPLQRSQTTNRTMDDGRGGGRGRGGKNNHGGGRGGRGNMNGGRLQDAFYMDPYSNETSMNTVGMIRGQPPPPPHQGGPPPPPQYFHGPQGHYPPGRGNSYPGSQGQQPGPHNMAPPPPQQMQHPPAPQQQLLPQQSVDTGEESK